MEGSRHREARPAGAPGHGVRAPAPRRAPRPVGSRNATGLPQGRAQGLVQHHVPGRVQLHWKAIQAQAAPRAPQTQGELQQPAPATTGRPQPPDWPAAAPPSRPPGPRSRGGAPTAEPVARPWAGPVRPPPPADDPPGRGGLAGESWGAGSREGWLGELAIQKGPDQQEQPGGQQGEHPQTGGAAELAVGGLQHHGGEGDLSGVGGTNRFNREGKGIQGR